MVTIVHLHFVVEYAPHVRSLSLSAQQPIAHRLLLTRRWILQPLQAATIVVVPESQNTNDPPVHKARMIYPSIDESRSMGIPN